MIPSSVVIQIGLWTMTLLVLVSAWFVVTLPNIFRAALSLGLVLVGVAGLFVLLEAEFLAFVQILIYVGAILTLVVFAIMLTTRLQGPTTPQANRQQLPAALFVGALFLVLTRAVWSLDWPTTSTHDAVSLSALGRELITTLVLPFEVISLVFVAAMVGAIAVAFSTPPNSAPQKSTTPPG